MPVAQPAHLQDARKTKGFARLSDLSRLRPPQRRGSWDTAAFVDGYLGVKVDRVHTVPPVYR